jgi:hypothetical protein
MSVSRVRFPVLMALAGGLLAVPACAPLGALDGVLLGGGGAYGSVLDGQVRSVDVRRSRMEIRDQWNRGHTLRVDGRTQVVYRQRAYHVDALERGDYVRVRVTRDRNGRLWADRIDVRESVRDRGSVYGRVERLDGRVLGVDSRRGQFVVEASRSQRVVVQVPHGVHRDDARRFQRLRRGDRVRVEVVPMGRGAAQLVRFR